MAIRERITCPTPTGLNFITRWDVIGKLVVWYNPFCNFVTSCQEWVKSDIERNLKGLGVVAYLGASGILNGGVGALWCPRDTFHHMFVLPQLSLTLFGRYDPHTHGLVVGAASNQCAVLVGPHHTDPLPVACEGLHTVSGEWKTQGCHHHIIKVGESTWISCYKNSNRGLKNVYEPAYPVATSHIFMVLSLEAEIMWSPLGMIATDETLWSCPGKDNNKI